VNQKVFSNRLRETLEICDLHYARMAFALEKLRDKFPLTETTYDQLSGLEISYTDQLVFRFTKLQDTMGQKLFRLILEGLEEEVENVSFIDVLNRLEKLEILEDQQIWLSLRETRNQLTHEYPFNRPEMVDGLNELSKQAFILTNLWLNLKVWCQTRFSIE